MRGLNRGGSIPPPIELCKLTVGHVMGKQSVAVIREVRNCLFPAFAPEKFDGGPHIGGAALRVVGVSGDYIDEAAVKKLYCFALCFPAEEESRV